MANIFESHLPQEGHRATESAHRKIELQSPADLTHLIANVTRAAQDKIDQHLPPSATSSDDVLRNRVSQLVDASIHSTFSSASDNITINGMSARELEAQVLQEGEELEPFDTKLAQKIQALSTQIEYQTLQLANLRRKAPQDTAEKFKAAFEREGTEFEKRLEAERTERMRLAGESSVMGVAGEVKRGEEVERQWMRGNEELERLNTGLEETRKRLEKAQKAVDVVVEK